MAIGISSVDDSAATTTSTTTSGRSGASRAGTVADDLDKVQTDLHDNGTLWPRTELLQWYSDGYHDLLARSLATSRLTQLPVPPRYAYTFTQEWEDAFTNQAPSRMMAWPSLTGVYRCTGYWEAEQLEGVTPADSRTGLTQDWERTHDADVDQHFTYALPHDTELIRSVRWDHKTLAPSTVREFDETDSAWMRRVGEPLWWTPGTARIGSIELYQIQTDYQLTYNLQGYEQYGFARGFSGSRTYTVSSETITNAYAWTTRGDSDTLKKATTALLTGLGWRWSKTSTTTSYEASQTWEIEQVEGSTPSTTGALRGTFGWEQQHTGTVIQFGVGTIRGITSEDRQYFAVGDNLGGIRALASSEDAIEVLHTVIPQIDLTEDDVPSLIPAPMQKYLRIYTLKRAFGRRGPGQRPDLAIHYDQRFEMGVKAMKKLGYLAATDQVWVRQGTDESASPRMPYVRLPAEFESVW